MEHTNIKYLRDVNTYIEDKNQTVPLYCRVKISENGMIGEISDYDCTNNKYLVKLSNGVAGFNNKSIFENKCFLLNEFELLDHGLNSPYIINIGSLLEIIE
jgi:hypothetical protein